MSVFKYNTQTSCLCGRGCVEAYADIFLKYGHRAAILTSKFAEGCRNYALEDVQAALDKRGIEYIVIDRVMENPPVESVAELSLECEDFGTQFFIAIGGGSSIDSAKAVSLLMKYPGVEPYEVFYGMGKPSDSLKTESDLPVFAIPTTAGTGAEVTGFACLTRSDTDTKLSMYPVVYCEAAFLDQFAGVSAPVALSGAVDTEQDFGELADGEYEATGAESDGYTPTLRMTVEGGKITEVYWDEIGADGKGKRELSESGEYTMTEDGPIWAEQADALADALIESQSLSAFPTDEAGKTDAVSGVSISIGGFLTLAADCMEQASGTGSGTGQQAPEGTQIDAVSGATYSSTAVVEGVNLAYEFVQSIAG